MHNDVRCTNCNEPASPLGKALPVDEEGNVVPVDGPGMVGGRPACDMCYALHAAAGSYGEAVLEAYAAQSEAMLSVIEDTRSALDAARAAVDKASDTLAGLATE